MQFRVVDMFGSHVLQDIPRKWIFLIYCDWALMLVLGRHPPNPFRRRAQATRKGEFLIYCKYALVFG